jgi:hypothetical protein
MLTTRVSGQYIIDTAGFMIMPPPYVRLYGAAPPLAKKVGDEGNVEFQEY